MDLKHLFLSVEGRIGRQAFWIGTLTIVVLSVAARFIDPIAAGIVALVLLYPHICVQGKRWHDRGKSAWWFLISLVPIIGWIWVIVECGCLAGRAEANQYGPPPTVGAIVRPTTT